MGQVSFVLASMQILASTKTSTISHILEDKQVGLNLRVGKPPRTPIVAYTYFLDPSRGLIFNSNDSFHYHRKWLGIVS